MRNLHRYIPALVMISLYALIVMSPLAPLAMRSAVIAHALTGECVNDCSVCGCSPERSANHTCCCWQKRAQLAHKDHDDHDDDPGRPDCCKKNSAPRKDSRPVICSRTCNGGKSIVLFGAAQGDVLPFCFTQGNLAVLESALTARTPVCRTDRTDEPPDPPPKLSRLS